MNFRKWKKSSAKLKNYSHSFLNSTDSSEFCKPPTTQLQNTVFFSDLVGRKRSPSHKHQPWDTGHLRAQGNRLHARVCIHRSPQGVLKNHWTQLDRPMTALTLLDQMKSLPLKEAAKIAPRSVFFESPKWLVCWKVPNLTISVEQKQMALAWRQYHV